MWDLCGRTGVVSEFVVSKNEAGVDFERKNVGLDMLDAKFSEDLKGKALKDCKGKQVLTILNNKYNYCIGMFDYLDCKERVFKDEESGLTFTVMKPDYLEKEIEQYKEELKRRQETMQMLNEV